MLNQYVFTRERRRFGRQPLFSDRNEMLFDEPSKHELFPKLYILRNPVHLSTQLSKSMSYSEVVTENPDMAHHGMTHLEGGWPKDVNYLDEEQSLRHRKKAERDDNYGKQLMSCTQPVLASVLQNNAVNIYQDYFTEIPPIELRQKFDAVNINIYHDIVNPIRPVVQLSWCPGESTTFLAVHSMYDRFPQSGVKSDFFIWDIDNSLNPVVTFSSPYLTTQAKYCPKDENLIAGGLKNGMSAVWDSRVSGLPVAICPLEAAHLDSVSAFTWVHSKSNTEFYTGSTDGSIYYWDGRNLRTPYNKVLLDTVRSVDQVSSRAHGCSYLEFEYTIPIRYMAGTEHGLLFLGNRKGTTPLENLTANFRVMTGPVKVIERHPAFPKNFMVIGDWCAKIWTEDCKDYPIARFADQETEINCGCWSQTRCSTFFTGNQDGKLDFWDLLLDQTNPIYSMQQFNAPISAMSAKEDGKLLAIGTKQGDIYMIKLSEAFTKSGNKDKPVIAAMMERELHRVKLLEGRVREIKLNAIKNQLVLSLDPPVVGEEEEETYIEEAFIIMDEGEEEDVPTPAPAPPPAPGEPETAAGAGAEEPVVIDIEEQEEEIIEEASDPDPEFTAMQNRFDQITHEEHEKNKEKEFIIEKCPFDGKGYIPDEALEFLDEENDEDGEEEIEI